jgi:2-amino-4-hydroxy-6-hydroxymethyldihydropteridine diphosphokinase
MTSDAADPETSALALLGRLKSIERVAGRRARDRWGPRELDLDLLVYGRHRVDVERSPEARSVDAAIDKAKAAKRLEVPHRHLGERLLVLAPLAGLAPRLVPPGWQETVETRRRRVAAHEPSGSVRVIGEWDQNDRRWRPVG